MRLYRFGDQGEAVRDIQDRLAALGYSCDPDGAGDFGDGTRAAVVAFQQARRLVADGIVGPDSWRTIVAAGYRLGDRLLYHRVPMMRGDDVADLQRRLNSLGFDAGKVDGVFGPDTLSAVLDFQANRRMAEDGIAGREVATELALMTRETAKAGRDDVRERQWLAGLPPTLVGQRVYVDAFCRTEEEAAATWAAALVFARIIQDLGALPTLSRSADTMPPPRVRALRANRQAADFIVSFAIPGTDTPGVWYFSSPLSSSQAGEQIARAVARVCGVEHAGRSIPMLKDTRSPAVVIAIDPMDAQAGGRAAQGIINLLARIEDSSAPSPEPAR